MSIREGIYIYKNSHDMVTLRKKTQMTNLQSLMVNALKFQNYGKQSHRK